MADETMSMRLVAYVREFNRKMRSAAASIKLTENMAQNAKFGSLFAISPTLVPALAAAAGGAGALASAFTSATAGVAAFGSVAATALSGVFEAQKNISKYRKQLAQTSDLKQRAKLTQKIADATKGLTAEQKKAVRALGNFEAFWHKFAQQFQNPVINIFVQALGMLQGIIQRLQPTFRKSTQAVQGLMDSLNKGLKSKDVESFFVYLNNTAGPAITTFGKVFGNIFRGIMNLMVTFSPLAMTVESGILRMSQAFLKWTQHLKDSKSFQAFVSYVKTNGPKILDLFGSLVQLLGDLMSALAPIGGAALSALVNFVKFADKMVKAHPQIVQILTVVIGFVGALSLLAMAFEIILSPIALVITILAGLAAAYIKHVGGMKNFKKQMMTLWQKFKTEVLPVIKNLWDNIKAAFQQAKKFILPLVKQLWTTVKGIFDQAKTVIVPIVKQMMQMIQQFMDKHGTQIKTLIKTAFTIILKIITLVSKAVIAIIKWAWPYVKEIIKFALNKVLPFVIKTMQRILRIIQIVMPVIVKIIKWAWKYVIKPIITVVMKIILILMKGTWDAIVNVISGALDIIEGIIQFFSDLFHGRWGKLWGDIKKILWGAVKLIWGWINLLFIGRILKAAKGFIKLFSGFFRGMWDTIRILFWDAIDWVKKTVFGGFKSMKKSVWDILKGVWNVIKNILKGIWDTFKSVWKWIKDLVRSSAHRIYQDTIGKFDDMYNGIARFMHNIFKKISGGFHDAINFLKNINLWQIGKDIIRGLVRGIDSINIAGIIHNIAESIPDGIKRFLGIHSPSTVLRKIGNFTVLGLVKGMVDQTKNVGRAALGVAKAAVPKALTSGSLMKNVLRSPKLSAIVNPSIHHTAALAVADANNRPIHIQIDMDGRTLARGTAPHLVDEIRLRTGLKLK